MLLFSLAACGEPEVGVYTPADGGVGGCTAVHQDAGPDQPNAGTSDAGESAFCSSQIAWAQLTVTNASSTEVTGQPGSDEAIAEVFVTAAQGPHCVHRSVASQVAFQFRQMSFPVTNWHLEASTGEVLATTPCSTDAHSDGLYVTFCPSKELSPGESFRAQVKGNTTAAHRGSTLEWFVRAGYALDKEDGSGFYMVGTPTPPVTRSYR
ncbi:MAG: hypothetical protein HY983_03395 [Candidatus Magasanikbacteria bacterium]|nr:hypothetical protein [Candidatus Magasanikbacteria bacterium]